MKSVSRSVFAIAWACAQLPAQSSNGAHYKVTGPDTHENLSVFLIHGPSRSTHKLLTLQEAIAQKKVVVYETRNVNQLAIENVSSDEDVFIESGDIVKGGQQDRTLKDDFILPTKSGKVEISSFCVEHGRWTQRGQESAATFGSANDMVATKELKMAVRVQADQSKVWNQVAEAQAKLTASTGAPARAAASPTSFAMTMQTEVVQKSTDGYIRELSGILDGKNDVVGYAFAINGKINSAEIYASHELFAKLWPKLLKASAVEAVSEFQPKAKFSAATVGMVTATLKDGESGEASARELNARTKVEKKETSKTVLFETRDRAADTWLHRSYLSKE
jgi:ARG/rhodanese/phosphatase superfamily protein